MAVSLDQKLKRLKIGKCEVEDELMFKYFDNLPVEERDKQFARALKIGVLALQEDRLSAFFSKTKNELGTELEHLKMIFDLEAQIFEKSTLKGTIAEKDICEFLNEYFKGNKVGDVAYLTGNDAGELDKNKTGDIVCEIGGDKNTKIAIECKFDKSIKLGDIGDKNVFLSRKTDTAISQLIESNANRDAKVSLIVLDRYLVDASILKYSNDVGYIPNIGFVAIVDSQRGDYSNLAIGYMLARNIAVSYKDVDSVDLNIFDMIVKRYVRDIKEFVSIKSLVESNINNNKAILKQIEKSSILADFNQKFLKMFLEKGTLSQKDLLDFYNAENVKGGL